MFYMCGAFTFTQYSRIIKQLGLEAGKDFLQERFNIRPTQNVPVVFNDAPKIIHLARWGITPSWGKDKGINLLFNTRRDSLIEKPYFKRLFHTNRCLIFADGFYEWAKVGSEKLPYRFVLKNKEPFAFAGIWDSNANVKQVSVITTEPNELVAKVHNRMPVMLTLDHALEWVENKDESMLVKFLNPLSEGLMESYRVSKEVNSSNNDSPELITEFKAA